MKAQAHKDLGTFFYDYSERVDQVSLCYSTGFLQPCQEVLQSKGQEDKTGVLFMASLLRFDPGGGRRGSAQISSDSGT